MTLDDCSRLLEAYDKLYDACRCLDHMHPPTAILPEMREVFRLKQEMAAIHAAGIRPEHGNRGQEQESMFLVSVRPGELLIRVQRPEGYEDVHPDLVVSDMGIKEAFPVEVVVDLPVAPGSYEPQ